MTSKTVFSCATLTLCSLLSRAQAQNPVTANVGEGAKTFDGSIGVPLHPLQDRELALKIVQPFTVVAVGDLLQFQPFALTNDTRTTAMLRHLHDADVAIGDFENEIYDFDTFGHYGINLGTKEVADDWARMGIDMVSRANNKSPLAPGVWEDLRQMERVGIIHTGVARSLPEARMARYFATPKGLVGEIGVTSEGGTDFCCSGGAVVPVTAEQLAQVAAMKQAILARRGEVETPVPAPGPDKPQNVALFGLTFRVGGKPTEAQPAAPPARGPEDAYKNAIQLQLYHGVTTSQMQLLRDIAGQPGTGDLHAFGTQFRTMEKPGEHSFDMSSRDLKEVLAQVRTAKQASDILLLNMHWHQNRYDFQAYSYDHFPADFEIAFAHDAIDNGVDVFVAQGVHTIKGVEIYKGKPIFYGTSNFIFQSALMPQGKGELPSLAEAAAMLPMAAVPSSKPAPAPVPSSPDGFVHSAKDIGTITGEHETQGFWQLKPNLEAILTETVFEAGKLKEVRVYPVDLGQTPRPSSQVGIPRTPTPEVAAKILNELVEYSKPFGTRITISNGVAIIHLQ